MSSPTQAPLTVIDEIRAEQEHGRTKYGKGPNDLEHDDGQPEEIWHRCIDDHNIRADNGTPMERRQHLIKVAGLAISAVEAFDRNRTKKKETILDAVFTPL